ncbi:tRNA glutamyl-Q(34) synthetase GluQRS [Verrucomicrobiales bacterium BCK34]|nr:tRNA glutamyl-Q(34) synthetase GluQRS [Verrucomicrobiales bacterium BCK34]
MPNRAIQTRFAPSPTGHLHKGHAYSALLAYRIATENNGRFHLRIEDIDHTRCTPENTQQIYDDLHWLGLEWEEPVRFQSEHLADFAAAAKQLEEAGWLYPCFCTRKEILREIETAGHAPHGAEGPLYPGICRKLSGDERQTRIAAGESHAMRLDLERALNHLNGAPGWNDTLKGPQEGKPETLGDAVIVRKDIGTSYHLAVVHDDALQGITDIVRGVDLFESTHIHRVLQELLGYPEPTYHHHELLTDDNGERLAKRNQSITLKSLRESGLTAAELQKRLNLSAQ